VADAGPGIAPENLERVFEPYFTTKAKGSGLGLAIVKHNAEIYGGRVAVTSELGKGTRFTVTLPARSLFRLRK
jgi:signal transduction histidine kinase